MCHYTIPCVITGSIAHSASRRYLSYSEAILTFFTPQGRHVAAMGVKFGMEEGTIFVCNMFAVVQRSRGFVTDS